MNTVHWFNQPEETLQRLLLAVSRPSAIRGRWVAKALAALAMMALADLSYASPSVSSASSQTFTVGQASTAAAVVTVTDDAITPTITAALDIRIRIPAGFNMTWDTSITTVTLGGTASGKVSTTLLAYEDSNHTLVVNVTSNFVAGDTLTLTGLKFNNFTAASNFTQLQLVVAGTGGATANTDNRWKSIQIPTPSLNSAANQTFSVGWTTTTASTMTVQDDPNVPSITAANDIRIKIPATFNMTWDTSITTVTLGGTASAKVSTTLLAYEDSSHTLVLNVTSNFAANDTLTISGLKFNNFTAISATDNLVIIIAGAGGATANSDNQWKKIQVPQPSLSSGSSQRFIPWQASTVANTMTVTDDAQIPQIKAATDLRIRIPATFNMTWDTSVTTVTLGGTASAKVSATVKAYEDSNHTLVLDVTSDFTGGQTLTIANAKFNNFTAISSQDYLQVVVAGSGGATISLDSQYKQIVAPTLSSAANQTFTIAAVSTAASTMTVTESWNSTLSIKTATGLRVRIPATFNMTWDTSITTVTLGGTASAKVSTTLAAYEDSNHTLVLTVTSNFSSNDTLTIAGVNFNNFSAGSAADYLQLVTAGSGGGTAAKDDKTKIIGGTKFYLHDATTPDTGSLPGGSTLSSTSPTVTASTASTNRDMNQTIGASQVGPSLTVLGNMSLQTHWFRRFLSRPLGTQTLPTGAWSIDAGSQESSINTNLEPWGMVLKVWRPSNGTTVSTLIDNPLLATSPLSTNGSELDVSTSTGSISGVAVTSGDVLVLELWTQATQLNNNPHTANAYYDGTTEGSTTSSAAMLLAPGNITFAGAGAVGFKISYSNYGLYCLAQSVTITAVDSLGNAVTGYTGTVNLTTTTARGTWTKTAGNGTLTDSVPDDGAATYAWNASDSAATFALSYKGGGATVTVNAVDSVTSSIKDDGTQGAIVFSPSGFTVTSSVFSNPAGGVPAFASPQVAGSNFSVYLTAYGQTPTDATCGIIAGYAGAKSLKFWSTYVNPASGTKQATINGTSSATVEGSSSAQSVTFTAGQATVTANYKDVGSLSLSMKDATTGNPGLPTGIRGTTGTFVSRPYDFVLSNIKRTSDNFANPGASTAGGTVFTGAGRAFTVTVTSTEAGGAATPNYGQETPAESVKMDVSLVIPSSGGNGPAISGTFGAFSGGAATGTAFSWAEAGIVNLKPRVFDGDYLGSGDFIGSLSGNVGRFTPDHFSTSLNTPVFGTGCSAGAYTYIGQPFTFTVAPVISVTAQSQSNSTTQNYTGSLFRLTNASLTSRTYTPTPASPALDVSGLPATSGDPTIVDNGAGLSSLTFSAGSGITFVRGSAIAPFTANIALSINVIDLDSVAATNPVTFGSGSGISFSTGATQRYGRLFLRDGTGSELLDLPMSLTTQYYTGTTLGFTTHTADVCTAPPAISFSNYLGSMSAGKTCVRDTGSPGVSGAGCATAAAANLRFRSVPVAGDFNLYLAAPGSGNSGALTVTATAPTWLKYLWNVGSGSNSSPTGVGTFGLFPGPTSRIYEREVY